MAVIPQGVEGLYHTIISYMITIVTILFFVKIVQLFMNIGGWGGGGSSSGSGSSKPGKPDSPTDKGEKPTIKDKFEEANKPENRAQFFVLVKNLDDKPVKGALVEMWPANTRILFKKRGYYGRYYYSYTNADGVAPSGGTPFNVPSVTMHMRVTFKLSKLEGYKVPKNIADRKWWQRWSVSQKNERFFSERHSFKLAPNDQSFKFIKEPTRVEHTKTDLKIETDIDLQPGNNPSIGILLPFESEYSIAYEPVIIKADLKTDDRGRAVIETKGIIRP